VAAVGGSLAVLWLVGSPIARTRTIEELDGVAESVRGTLLPAGSP
jgi:hypothetical protein